MRLEMVSKISSLKNYFDILDIRISLLQQPVIELPRNGLSLVIQFIYVP